MDLMRWPWGTVLNDDQRKETAHVLLSVCQIVLVALLASPFLPEVADKLGFWERFYGAILDLILYLVAMRLLRK